MIQTDKGLLYQKLQSILMITFFANFYQMQYQV